MSKGLLILAILSATSTLAPAQAPSTTKGFDRFVGVYQVTAALFLWVRREGDRIFVRNTNQGEHEAIPQNSNTLIFSDAPLQMVFTDKEVVLRNGTLERHAVRVSAEYAKANEEALMARVKNNVPSPGTEGSLRRYIESLEKGTPNYEEMGATQAQKVRDQLPDILANIKRLGAFKSLTFKSVSPDGTDIYEAEFEHGKAEGRMAPLTSDGKVELRGFRPLP